MALEEQVRVLSSCGVTARAGVGEREVLEAWTREEYEENPYALLLIALGGQYEKPEGVWHDVSDRAWYLDTACVDGPGAYARIAERMAALSRGVLALRDVRDDVDEEQGRAEVSFVLDGTRVRWELEVDEEWVDPTVFSRFAALLAKRGKGPGAVRYAVAPTGGRDAVVLGLTAEEFDRLTRATGLDVRWLE